MSSNSTTSWGFFFLRQIHLQRRTTGTQQPTDPTVFFELHTTDVRYATRVESKKSLIDNAIEDFNLNASTPISLTSGTYRTALFCIITGFSTCVRLDTDNIDELSDFRLSLLASSIYIVPSTKFDVPERILNRAMARNDSFDFVNRPTQTASHFRVDFNGDDDGNTTMTLVPTTNNWSTRSHDGHTTEEENITDSDNNSERNDYPDSDQLEEGDDREEDDDDDDDDDDAEHHTSCQTKLKQKRYRAPKPTSSLNKKTNQAPTTKPRQAHSAPVKRTRVTSVEVVIQTTDDDDSSVNLEAFDEEDLPEEDDADSLADDYGRDAVGNLAESSTAQKRKRQPSDPEGKGKKRA